MRTIGRIFQRVSVCVFAVLLAAAAGDAARALPSPRTDVQRPQRAAAPLRLASNQTNPAQSAEVNVPCGARPNPIAALQPKAEGSGKPVLQNGTANAEVSQATIGQIIANQSICDNSICVSLPKVSASIHKALDCNVVGYAFFVGNTTTGLSGLFGSYGKARTKADPPEQDFKPTTKMQIASTSKVLTALTAMRAMNSAINNNATTYFPQGWTLPQGSIVANIKVRQLISQTSGVQQYYASQNGQDYTSLKNFFTQPIPNPNAAWSCPGPPNPNATPPIGVVIPNPIISSTQSCYTDTAFGMMRIVLARWDGSNSIVPQTLANKYVGLVQSTVFAPVGVTDVACAPPANGQYALLYKYPGTQAGYDWKDLSLSCGDWGWYVSVKDYASVLVSLNAQDGKILGNCGLDSMVTNTGHAIGWDITADGQGHRWLEKNGADGAGSGQLQTTSVGIYGGSDGCVVKGVGAAPVPGVAAVLFINSNINGATFIADTVLLNALHDGTSAKP